MESKFSKEEIKAAIAVREQIVNSDESELKGVYMAGEICMWHELNSQPETVPVSAEEEKDVSENKARWFIKHLFILAQKGGGYTLETEDHFLKHFPFSYMNQKDDRIQKAVDLLNRIYKMHPAREGQNILEAGMTFDEASKLFKEIKTFINA